MSFLPNRPLYRRLLIFGVVVGTLLVGLCLWAMYSRYSYGARLAAIRSAGDPASIADLAPQPVSIENDAAAQLAAVATSIDAFAREHGRFFNTPTGKAYEAADDRDEPATAEQLAAIGAIVENYPELDAAIARAAACDGYASRLDYSLPGPAFLAAMGTSPTTEIRTIARFVRWQMELAVAEGRRDKAIASGIQLLRLARLFDAEPGLVSSMLADAVRYSAADALYHALAAGEVSRERHAQLDDELTKHGDGQSLIHTLKSERAINISMLEAQFGGWNPLVMNTVGWPLRMHQASILDLHEALLPVVARPWHEVHADPKLKALFQAQSGEGVMADLLLPSIEAVHKLANRSAALVRSLRIQNALSHFADEHGREANGLAELALPKEATIEPFSGEPLVVKHTEDGWMVYSVAENGVDDGGSFDDQKDWGLGPRNKAAE